MSRRPSPRAQALVAWAIVLERQAVNWETLARCTVPADRGCLRLAQQSRDAAVVSRADAEWLDRPWWRRLWKRDPAVT